MTTITRKDIETYFEEEWTENLSTDTLLFLIEKTCKEYRLNKKEVKESTSKTQTPHDLGQI